MATTGTVLLDFGVFPGSSHATVAVTGQNTIINGTSFLETWLAPAATVTTARMSTSRWTRWRIARGSSPRGSGANRYPRESAPRFPPRRGRGRSPVGLPAA